MSFTQTEHFATGKSVCNQREVSALKTHVLLIDDCPNISTLLSVIIDRFFTQDVRLSPTNRLSDGLQVLAVDHPDAILLDYSLQPSMGCGESIEALRNAGFEGPIHIWSNQDHHTLLRDPATHRAANLFQKHDYVGLRLRQLVQDHFCRPVGPAPTPHHAQSVSAVSAT